MLNARRVGRDDLQFWIFDGFHEISDLNQVMGLAISGIIIRAQLMFSNVWLTAPDVLFDIL